MPLALLLAGCAAGEIADVPDGLGRTDSEPRQDLWRPQDSFPRQDLRAGDSRPPDLRPADLNPPLDGPAHDGSQSCTDLFEPNNSCGLAGDLGLVYEGNGFSGQSATLNPAADADWYQATALEVASMCWPGDLQCFRFSVRVDVPAGRRLRACLYRDACSGGPVCDSNTSPGPASFELEYLLAGTCGGSDDTTAFIEVTAEDGLGGCSPYGIAFRYDGC